MNDAVDDGNVRLFPGTSPPDSVDMAPGTTYEVVTRLKVEELATDVKQIRERLDNIFWLIAASIVIQIVARAVGLGH